MNKRYSKILGTASAAALMVSAAAYAQETINMGGSVTVLNNISIQEITPLSFGTLFITESNINNAEATLQLPADGSGFVSSGIVLGANIVSADNAPVPGLYRVEIGVPNVTLNVSGNVGGGTINIDGGTSGVDITAVDVTPTLTGSPGLFVTDAAGVLEFQSGMTIQTRDGTKNITDPDAGASVLANGNYSGNYKISVNY